ncbi:hypothetical protein EAH87_11405 [Sphingomonas koreensis]|nr:hypothetical protein EAH87_11405 [Sphingomonas koreensis]
MGRRSIGAAATIAALLAAGSAKAESKCSVGVMLTLPVTMAGRQPTVPVTINGHKLMLIADSGAFFSTLSPDTAAEYGLKLHDAPFGFYMTGIGGRAEASVATVADFELSGQTIHHVDFLVGGSTVGQAGLLGQNVLGIADAEYDLANGAVRLIKAKDCGHTNLAYWAKDKPVSVVDIQPPSQAGMHTQGTVILNGVKLRAMFDTGAATSVLTRQAAARAGVKPGDPGVVEGGDSRGLGRNVRRTWIGSFDSLQIGDNETIKKIHLRFGDIGDGDTFDMLIGADFFLSHRVYVSNATHRMFFTYNGGPVFDLSVHHDTPTASAAVSGSEPTTAQAYSGRGTAFAARHEYQRAIADLGHAIALDPSNPHYHYQRATIAMATKDDAAAARDLDAAIKLAPQDVEALMARAWLRSRAEDHKAAREDADAAARVAAKPNDVQFDLGQLYDVLDAPDQAIEHYGLWIDAHPHDSRLPEALNNRCWLRTLAGRDLEAALDDCDRALRLRPHAAMMLDSRGLTRLRMGDPKKAIDDYTAALKTDPRLAWSLYGRGLARHRLGMTVQGDADIAAAKAIQPDIAAEAARHGIGASE